MQALKNKQNTLLESPTGQEQCQFARIFQFIDKTRHAGSGKSLAILCATLGNQ